eukprot:TRINITY_DN6998_c0_g1_i1.p1 TRINITY_DN6998_c0_g1~~TRINITY_DN6998_c0_g1_i1.p1  ORF type:complete len:305 (-),score=27.02 TRINITY_DN6998_c0_g1_i1:343-1191(-)
MAATQTSRLARGRHPSYGSSMVVALLLGVGIGSLFNPAVHLLTAFSPISAIGLSSWFRSSRGGSSQAVLARTIARGSGRQLQVSRRSAPIIGTEAPDFTAKAVGTDQDFLDVRLSSYRGKYVVLFFYPLDFTFVCPTEIIAFSDRFSEFKDLNAEVLGVSVDSEFAHLAWIQTPREEGGLGELEFPLVSDLKKELATSYGVLGPDGAAYRGLFIIDKEGVIQHSTINSMAFGRNIDEVLRVLQAIRYVQENPDEVCPAGWQPGDKTMRPDAEGVKEYLSGSK